MNWEVFWQQIFYPLKNTVELFFAILFALLVARIAEEMENAGIISSNNNSFFGHLGEWILRYVIAFFVTLVVVFLIIAVVSILLAIFGVIKLGVN